MACVSGLYINTCNGTTAFTIIMNLWCELLVKKNFDVLWLYMSSIFSDLRMIWQIYSSWWKSKKNNFYFNSADIFFSCAVYRCDIYWLKHNGLETSVCVLPRLWIQLCVSSCYTLLSNKEYHKQLAHLCINRW